ncbi:hypothetical protein F383_21959 [Gossypium arboreum]|uniref:Uncharacterized protein n=1 Tax=Gossypium arboreum TaxID=29729 RepID=A0A0B0NTW4_GOSAR|nr:hypothetical protein F383_21959 [Gossypium arboreum]
MVLHIFIYRCHSPAMVLHVITYHISML